MARDGYSHDRVIVVGGGLAGIAAAMRLADHGTAVTLVETRKHLGGRAASFTDPATGQTLDNCQHVLLRSCTNLLDLYQRLGVDDRITWHRALHFADLRGRIDTLAGDDLPAPLHLLRSLLAFRTLKPRHKLAVMRGMLGVLQVPREGRRRLGRETFRDWLEHHHQPRELIDTFWSVIITSACNETPDRVAASHAVHVLQEGLLYDNHAYEMGVPATTLSDLYTPAQERIERAGGEIILGSGADQLLYDRSERRVTYLRLNDRQELPGSAFVAAVPPDRLARIVTDTMIADDDRLGALDQLPTSPIIGIHLFYQRDDQRPVMDLPHVAIVDGQVQWVFNKGSTQEAQAPTPQHTASPLRAVGSPGRPAHHLHCVISAAHELVHEPTERIVELAVNELARVLPATADARLVHSRVIKEKRATFAARPGVEALRPRCTAPPIGVENLYLAGDWTHTGWPATMEGAVRSGYRAAAAILRRRAPHLPVLPAGDLAPSPLYRVLSA